MNYGPIDVKSLDLPPIRLSECAKRCAKNPTVLPSQNGRPQVAKLVCALFRLSSTVAQLLEQYNEMFSACLAFLSGAQKILPRSVILPSMRRSSNAKADLLAPLSGFYG
jgi:hypothetical protein